MLKILELFAGSKSIGKLTKKQMHKLMPTYPSHIASKKDVMKLWGYDPRKAKPHSTCCRCGMDKSDARKDKSKCFTWGKGYKNHIWYY